MNTISSKKARELNPDYFLVTPWGFVNEFRKREIKWKTIKKLWENYMRNIES